MNIELIRNEFTDKATIGSLLVDGIAECYICEDKDRGLDDSMGTSEIIKIKVHGLTCIPYGKYKVIVTKSERFSKQAGHDVYLPLLLNVKGFEGVRIHPGNRPEDSDGCLLPGMQKGINEVLNSRTAFVKLNEKINLALKKEDVWITIRKEGL